MQEISLTPKKGYKFVKTLFGKYEEIPETWDLVKLISLCKRKPQYGASVPALPKNYTLPRYIRITDLNDDGSLREDEWMSIAEEDAQPYILSEGEIIFARTGATVGKTYLYKKEHGKCAFAGYLIRFIPDKERLDPTFIFYYTHSYNYWRWLRSFQTEGVQPNVNAEQYSQLPVITPPLPHQQKIASILSSIDSLIRQTQKIIEQTQRLKKGLMQKLLTKGIGHSTFKKVILFPRYNEETIPEGWDVDRLDNLIRIIDYRGRTPPFSQSGIPHLRSNNIRNGQINFDDITFVSEKTYEEYMTRGIPQEDDVLFTTEGPLGEVAFVPKNFKFSLEVNNLNSQYLGHMQSDQFRGRHLILKNQILAASQLEGALKVRKSYR